MKGGTQAAVALGFGYLLGRRRRLRRAVILAGVTASGSFGTLSKALVGRGLKALESTELIGKLAPQLGEIADTARSELAHAGKTAAMALVSNRVEALSDSLHARADVLRDPAAAGTGVVELLRRGGGGQHADGGGAQRRPARAGQPDEADEDRGEHRAGRRRDVDTRDEFEDGDEDEYEDEYEFEDEDNDAEDEFADDGEDEYDDEYEDGDVEDDEDDETGDGAEPAAATRRRSRVPSSPVSRAGR